MSKPQHESALLVVQGEIMLQQRAMLAARIADDRLKMPCDGR
jgi:hypothetical protein